MRRGVRLLLLHSCRLASTRALTLPPLLPLADPAALKAAHFFSPTASWLVPGHVLCGRYPGSCPSRPVEPATQLERISVIKEHVSTFVCLQAELPPQDGDWPAGGVSAQSGNAVQPQTETFKPYYRDAAGAETAFLHYPIPDRGEASTLESLDALVFELRNRVLANERLYIHCWGGRGRTGLVAACLLGALYPQLVSADEALERAQADYALREPSKGGSSPETEGQRQQVRDWYRWVKGGGIRVGKRRETS